MTRKSRILIVFGALLHIVSGAGPASALSCSADFTVNFGTVDLTAGTAIPGTGTVNITCNGGTQGQFVRTCTSIGAARQMTRSAGGVLNYDLYSDSSHQTVWGSASGPLTPAVDMTLGVGGSGSGSTPIYSLILSSQTAAPTTNLDSLYAAAPAVSTASADATGNPSCTTIGSTNATPGTASVAATYQPTCTMSANALNFGSIASTSSATGGSSSLTTRCSASTPYTISLNGGLSGASNPAQRLMTHGADQLVYGLYQDSNHAQVWGTTPGANVLAGSGTGSTLAVPVFGLIPSQITPPIGTYTDTVIVTLQY